jgi:hypothetical protein
MNYNTASPGRRCALFREGSQWLSDTSIRRHLSRVIAFLPPTESLKIVWRFDHRIINALMTRVRVAIKHDPSLTAYRACRNIVAWSLAQLYCGGQQTTTARLPPEMET